MSASYVDTISDGLRFCILDKLDSRSCARNLQRIMETTYYDLWNCHVTHGQAYWGYWGRYNGIADNWGAQCAPDKGRPVSDVELATVAEQSFAYCYNSDNFSRVNCMRDFIIQEVEDKQQLGCKGAANIMVTYDYMYSHALYFFGSSWYGGSFYEIAGNPDYLVAAFCY